MEQLAFEFQSMVVQGKEEGDATKVADGVPVVSSGITMEEQNGIVTKKEAVVATAAANGAVVASSVLPTTQEVNGIYNKNGIRQVESRETQPSLESFQHRLEQFKSEIRVQPAASSSIANGHSDGSNYDTINGKNVNKNGVTAPTKSDAEMLVDVGPKKAPVTHIAEVDLQEPVAEKNERPELEILQDMLDQAKSLLSSASNPMEKEHVGESKERPSLLRSEVEQLIKEIQNHLYPSKPGMEDVVAVEVPAATPATDKTARTRTQVAEELEAAFQLYGELGDEVSFSLVEELALEFQSFKVEDESVPNNELDLSAAADRIIPVVDSSVLSSLRERLDALHLQMYVDKKYDDNVDAVQLKMYVDNKYDDNVDAVKLKVYVDNMYVDNIDETKLSATSVPSKGEKDRAASTSRMHGSTVVEPRADEVGYEAKKKLHSKASQIQNDADALEGLAAEASAADLVVEPRQEDSSLDEVAQEYDNALGASFPLDAETKKYSSKQVKLDSEAHTTSSEHDSLPLSNQDEIPTPEEVLDIWKVMTEDEDFVSATDEISSSESPKGTLSGSAIFKKASEATKSTTTTATLDDDDLTLDAIEFDKLAVKPDKSQSSAKAFSRRLGDAISIEEDEAANTSGNPTAATPTANKDSGVVLNKYQLDDPNFEATSFDELALGESDDLEVAKEPPKISQDVKDALDQAETALAFADKSKSAQVQEARSRLVHTLAGKAFSCSLNAALGLVNTIKEAVARHGPMTYGRASKATRPQEDIQTETSSDFYWMNATDEAAPSENTTPDRPPVVPFYAAAGESKVNHDTLRQEAATLAEAVWAEKALSRVAAAEDSKREHAKLKEEAVALAEKVRAEKERLLLVEANVLTQAAALENSSNLAHEKLKEKAAALAEEVRAEKERLLLLGEKAMSRLAAVEDIKVYDSQIEEEQGGASSQRQELVSRALLEARAAMDLKKKDSISKLRQESISRSLLERRIAIEAREKKELSKRHSEAAARSLLETRLQLEAKERRRHFADQNKNGFESEDNIEPDIDERSAMTEINEDPEGEVPIPEEVMRTWRLMTTNQEFVTATEGLSSCDTSEVKGSSVEKSKLEHENLKEEATALAEAVQAEKDRLLLVEEKALSKVAAMESTKLEEEKLKEEAAALAEAVQAEKHRLLLAEERALSKVAAAKESKLAHEKLKEEAAVLAEEIRVEKERLLLVEDKIFTQAEVLANSANLAHEKLKEEAVALAEEVRAEKERLLLEEEKALSRMSAVENSRLEYEKLKKEADDLTEAVRAEKERLLLEEEKTGPRVAAIEGSGLDYKMPKADALAEAVQVEKEQQLWVEEKEHSEVAAPVADPLEEDDLDILDLLQTESFDRLVEPKYSDNPPFYNGTKSKGSKQFKDIFDEEKILTLVDLLSKVKQRAAKEHTKFLPLFQNHYEQRTQRNTVLSALEEHFKPLYNLWTVCVMNLRALSQGLTKSTDATLGSLLFSGQDDHPRSRSVPSSTVFYRSSAKSLHIPNRDQTRSRDLSIAMAAVLYPLLLRVMPPMIFLCTILFPHVWFLVKDRDD